MTSMLFWIILVAIWSIIPAMVAALVLFMRVLADERRIEAMEIRKLDYDNINSELSKAKSGLLDVQAETESLKESLGFLNAKWNSRLRAEQVTARRNEKKNEKENEPAAGDGMDGSEIPAQYRMELPLPPAAQTPKRRRPFGQFP